MALKGDIQKENGAEIFVAKFNNGTFEQLKDLGVFLKKEGITQTEDPIDVLKVAIGFLQAAKENKDKN